MRTLINNAESQFKLKLIPSANIEITGRLTLDALVVESGLKTVSTLYTTTGGDVTINLSDLKGGFDVKFGLPIQEQKLLAADHEIVFHTREQAGHEVNTPLKFAQQKDFSICIDQLSPFIGLVFCADLNGPNLAGKHTPILPFPLAGDAKLAVVIENEDLDHFHVKGSISKSSASVEFVVAAVGKNNQKKTEFTFNAELHPEKYIKAVLNSPLKAAYAEARITDTQTEKSVMAKFGHDQTEFYGKLGISISGSQKKFIYKPILELKSPDGMQQSMFVKLDGQLIAEETSNGRKFTLDNVKVTLPNGEQYGISGNLGSENDAFFSDLVVTNGQASANFKGMCRFSAKEKRKTYSKLILA